MIVHVNKNTPYLSFIEINPGETIVIKPNLVKEFKENDPNEWESVITSKFLIRTVAEYVCARLNKSGRLIICDAPQTDSSFSAIAERLGLVVMKQELESVYGVPVEIIDLRDEEWVSKKGVILERKKLAGDPYGKIAFNLSEMSLFFNHKGENRFYGADYNYDEVNKHHRGSTQEYLICAAPILADVFINLPKLKTHKKTGVTLSLKNLVGINADKNWLPHHTFGSPSMGGDEFPDTTQKRKIESGFYKIIMKTALRLPVLGTRIAIIAKKIGKHIFGASTNTIRSGNWYGNDTTWRMVLDLNRCLLYGDAQGRLAKKVPKRYYTVIDGVIGMDGAGPMQGNSKKCGIFISGTDPVPVDAVGAAVMGFDWRKIPVIREAFNASSHPISTCIPEEIRIQSNDARLNGLSLIEMQNCHHFNFEPHFGWKGHIELPSWGAGILED